MISIIVTTLNEEQNICRLLDSIVDTGVKNVAETVIVDADSADNTVTVATEYTFARVIQTTKCTRGAGRNVGAAEARGDVLCFLDADTKLTTNWLPALQDALQHADIVAGHTTDPTATHSLARVSIYADGNDLTWPTCNIAYKRKIFETIGGFDVELITAEDIDFNYRCVKAGYNIHYSPAMLAYHYHRKTKLGFAKQSFWYGYGRKQLNRKHPELTRAHQHSLKLAALARLGFGAIGYVFGDYARRGDR